MMRSLSSVELTRAAEHARVARWFRDTEYGHIFHGPDGRAWPIDADQRAVWEARAIAHVDAALVHYRRLPLYMFTLMLLLFIGWTGVLAGLRDAVPALARIPVPLVLLAALPLPLLLFAAFRLRQDTWRRAMIATMPLAAPLPEQAIQRHRRHNLFARGRDAVVVAMMVTGGIGVLHGDPTGGPVIPALFALLAVAWLLHWAAGRVDATHRRRRWVD